MSLLRTLATVAAGVALAKGAEAVSRRARSGGGLLDQLQNTRGSRGGVDIGSLLGGAGGSAGGLGDILEGLGGGGQAGGLAGLLAGGAGGSLGSLLGGAQAGAGSTPGFGTRLNEALASGGEPKSAPTVDEEAMAGLMIRAMIMAAKSDGRIDAEERAQLLDRLSDASAEERAFVEEELAAPIDVQAFAHDVPRDTGLRRQIFGSALMAIDLDSPSEMQFMSDLAGALDIPQRDLQAIAAKLGGGIDFG